MRKSTKLVGALAVAGLVAAGGSAFTASNDFSAVTTALVGYGQETNTGATVTQITYTPWATDASKLASVAFVVTDDVTLMTATMTLKLAGAVAGSPYSCSVSGSVGSQVETCATAAHPDFTAFDSTGLTVIEP